MNGRTIRAMKRQASKVAHQVLEPTANTLAGAAERQGKLLLQHNEKLREHAGTINLHASVLTGDFKTRLWWLLFGVPKLIHAIQPEAKPKSEEPPAETGKENA